MPIYLCFADMATAHPSGDQRRSALAYYAARLIGYNATKAALKLSTV